MWNYNRPNCTTLGVCDMAVDINSNRIWHSTVRQAPGVKNKDFSEDIRVHATSSAASSAKPTRVAANSIIAHEPASISSQPERYQTSSLSLSTFDVPRRSTSMLSLVDTNQETRVLSPLPVSKAASQRDLSVVSTSEPHMHAESAVHFKLPVTQAEAALRNLFTGKAATPRKASNDVTKATNAPAQNKEKTSWLQDTAPEAPAPSPDQSRPSAVSWLQDEPKHTVSTARAQSAKPTWLGADDTAHTPITPTATSAVPAARTSAHARTDAASPLSSESARQTRAFSAQTRDAVAVSKHTGSSSGWTIPKSRRDNERLLEDLVMEQYRSILGAAQVRLSRLSFYHAQANILIFDF